MKLIIDHEKKRKISIKIDEEQRIQDLKNKLQMKKIFKMIPWPRISSEYIVLRFNGVLLDNNKIIRDCGLKDKSAITMSLSVPLQKNQSTIRDNKRTIDMPYNANVSALISDCKRSLSLSVIGVGDGRRLKENKLVRAYLRKTNNFLIKNLKSESNKKSSKRQSESNKGVGGGTKINEQNMNSTFPLVKNEKRENINTKSKERIRRASDPYQKSNIKETKAYQSMDQPNNEDKNQNSKSNHLENERNKAKFTAICPVDTHPQERVKGGQQRLQSTQQADACDSLSRKYVVKTSNDVPIIESTKEGGDSKHKDKSMKSKELGADINSQGRNYSADNLTEDDKHVKLSSEASANKISLMVKHNMAKNGDNSTIISVDASCTIDELRKEISQTLKIVSCNFDLFYSDKVLRRGDMAKFGIKNKSCLVLKFRDRVPEHFILKVKCRTENATKESEQGYLIDDFETVEALKRSLRERYKVSIDRLKLSYEGKELENEDIVKDLGIPNLSTLILEIETKKEDALLAKINLKVLKNLSDEEECLSGEISLSEDIKIDKLRQILETKFHFQAGDGVLSFNGEILKHDNLLSSYGIKDGDEVIISRSLLIRIFLAADNNSAKVHRFPFFSTDKVSDLKERISTKVNIPTRSILLTFDGSPLEDGETLRMYCIENDSYIMMVSTLLGGI